jgi:hypothetical protein
MAGNLLRKTKEIEDNVYKIDFGVEDETEIEAENEKKTLKEEAEKLDTEIAKELQPKNGKIIKIIDDDDEIDDIFGNVGGLDIEQTSEEKQKDETEQETVEKTKKRKLARIEDGIKSSKVSKKTSTKVKNKVQKISKTPAKRGRKPKLKDIETIADNQSAIKMHTEGNLTEIILLENKYKIELQKNEYNIYTEANETSYIIVRETMLRIVSGGVYILIEKQGEDYAITTNQDFKINYIIDNLERKNNAVNFKLTNLTEIVANEDGINFEIDEEKVIENSLEDNKTLVISEEDGKVYLPYTKEDIKKDVLQNKGAKISEVIDQKYVLPLDKYKNSMRARFREGYNLMYYREKKSKRSAIMLGIELMFESNLHPAIISACKTLEELDIYLDCLEDNELEKFSCFKIIYKSLPTLHKNNKAQEF